MWLHTISHTREMFPNLGTVRAMERGESGLIAHPPAWIISPPQIIWEQQFQENVKLKPCFIYLLMNVSWCSALSTFHKFWNWIAAAFYKFWNGNVSAFCKFWNGNAPVPLSYCMACLGLSYLKASKWHRSNYAFCPTDPWLQHALEQCSPSLWYNYIYICTCIWNLMKTSIMAENSLRPCTEQPHEMARDPRLAIWLKHHLEDSERDVCCL